MAEHARSIQQVEEHADRMGEWNLCLGDFSCRYLVADDIWIPLAETLLIAHYRPVWNVVIDGFGNHAPGGGRKRQARSSWDELHPGRPWAAELPEPRKSASQLGREVLDHFARFTGPNLEAIPTVDEQVERALAEETDD